jgi:replicative DNA helicase
MSSGYEQAVLGAVMLDEASYWRVADLIGANDFSDPAHAEIFEAIGGLAKQGKPVDPVTMGDVLPQHAGYLCDIAANCTVANVRHYAEEVRKAGEGRRVKRAGQQIAATQCSYSEAQQILAAVAPRDSHAVKPIKAYMQDALALMQKRCDSQDVVTGLATGLDGLDALTSGLQPGTLNIVAARPSMGKTAFAMQIATRTALRKKRVAVFALEMTGVQLSERAVSLISGVPFGKIKSPRLLDEADWPRITDAYGRLERSALVVDESGSQTADSICARARQLHMQEALSLIVIDHLGLIDLPGKGSPVSETGQVTKQLKALAKELGIPVILLVQLNRGVEQRADKKPVLSDLRESGRIEEDADLVLMLYRDDYYNANSPAKGYAELLIRKNRDGETASVPLLAKLAVMRFESCEGLPNAANEKSFEPAIDFGIYADRKTAAAGGD